MNKLNKENLKEELKGLNNEIREFLIQEAKERGDYFLYNEDGSIDLIETRNINGMHLLTQGWTIDAPFDFDKDGKEEDIFRKEIKKR